MNDCIESLNIKLQITDEDRQYEEETEWNVETLSIDMALIC